MVYEPKAIFASWIINHYQLLIIHYVKDPILVVHDVKG